MVIPKCSSKNFPKPPKGFQCCDPSGLHHGQSSQWQCSCLGACPSLQPEGDKRSWRRLPSLHTVSALRYPDLVYWSCPRRFLTATPGAHSGALRSFFLELQSQWLKRRPCPSNPDIEHTFAFDYVFWSMPPEQVTAPVPFAGQEEVYEQVGVPQLDSMFEGYNGCIFAYGQTSSGVFFRLCLPSGRSAAPLFPSCNRSVIFVDGGDCGGGADEVHSSPWRCLWSHRNRAGKRVQSSV